MSSVARTVGGIAGIPTQTPTGALVDRLRSKRALITAGIVGLAAGSLLIAFVPAGPGTDWRCIEHFRSDPLRHSARVVGHEFLDRRQGRNQAFNSAGNVAAAVSMGVLGRFISNRSIFFFVAACTFPTILTLLLIRPDEIDYERARGGHEGGKGSKAEKSGCFSGTAR